jgi:hypothetical protein
MATPPPPPPPPAENLNVLDFWPIYSDAPNALYKDFADEALARLDERRTAVAQLQTRGDWERYRQKARENIIEIVGPFPEKTPLNARVVGVVQKGSFRIEKVIYESQPGFPVTAALFVPEPLHGRAPAIVYCSGHSDAGFRVPAYQTMIVNLVRKGFVVLAFDPIGQGERLQYLDHRTGLSEFGRGSSTREHSRAGSQCFMTGSSLARYMIWDGIRSVDYLLTRPEVDPARLGITGRSGGGTQTAYIAAIEDRLHAAAPENYLTTFEKLLQSRGPQDAEQNFPRGIARGFDQADLLLARAPKPALIVATTRDIFSIEGTLAVQAEAQRAAAALGAPDSITMTVDDAEHTSTTKNRRATYAFFRQHLDLPGDTTDETIAELSAEDLRITDTGQVASSLRPETVFSLNRREAEALEAKLDDRRRDLPSHLANVKREAARLSGYAPLAPGRQDIVFSGRLRRTGYVIEKYLLPVDPRYAIPVLAFVPEGQPRQTILHLDPRGKSAAAAPGGDIESLVQRGCLVIAPDIPGEGELGPGAMLPRADLGVRLWYGFVTLGRSTLGRQMNDVMRTVRFAGQRFGVAPRDLLGIARGTFGPLLLHTAAIEGVFARVAVSGSPVSYRSIVMTENYPLAYTPAVVPAAITAYDLPDLAASLAPRKVLLLDPRDGRGDPADAATLDEDTAVTARAFAGQGAREAFAVARPNADAPLAAALGDWLR